MGDSPDQLLQTLTDAVPRWAKVIGLHINVEKTKKNMGIGRVSDTWQLTINGKPADGVDECCYLGSVVTNTSSCNKEIRTRIGKANSAFKRLDCIW